MSNCSVKKKVYNYSTNKASSKTFPTISTICMGSATFKYSSYKKVSLQLNPFKSYSGSIGGFGTAIKNKF